MCELFSTVLDHVNCLDFFGHQYIVLSNQIKHALELIEMSNMDIVFSGTQENDVNSDEKEQNEKYKASTIPFHHTILGIVKSIQNYHSVSLRLGSTYRRAVVSISLENYSSLFFIRYFSFRYFISVLRIVTKRFLK